MSTKEISPIDRWLIFGVTGSGIFLATSAVTVVNVALPFITETFQSSISMTQWILSGSPNCSISTWGAAPRYLS